MTGREKIEAAFSADGARELPVVICYEGIFTRDHWEQVSSHPWWFRQAPDIARQVAWRRDAIRQIGQDWFELPRCMPLAERRKLEFQVHGHDVQCLDKSTHATSPVSRPAIGGWSPESGSHSVTPDRIAETEEDIDELIPPPDDFDAAQFKGDRQTDLADLLVADYGAEL